MNNEQGTRLRKAYADALSVQTACNASGMLSLLCTHMPVLQEHMDKSPNEHTVVKMFLLQLCELAGLEVEEDMYMTWKTECEQGALGKFPGE